MAMITKAEKMQGETTTEPKKANANTVDPATHLKDAQCMGRDPWDGVR